MSTKILDIIRDATNDTVVTLVTHAGKFHADDVMSTAILVLLLEKCGIRNIRRVRTFNPTEAGYTDDTPNCIVYDIGLGQYDHHQTGDAAKHCIRLDDELKESTLLVDLSGKKLVLNWLVARNMPISFTIALFVRLMTRIMDLDRTLFLL